MKFAYLLAISAALALSPIAQAQISCQQANDLIEAAYDEFSSVTGEKVEEGIFRGTDALEGASGCQVHSDFSVAYSCMWVFETLSEAQRAYEMQSGALGSCFDNWTRDPFTTDSGETGVKSLDGATFFSLDDDGGEFTWIAYLEEHVVGDARYWHVWVGLDYF